MLNAIIDDSLLKSKNMRALVGGISRMTEHRWRQRGILKAVSINGQNYYRTSDIQKLQEQGGAE